MTTDRPALAARDVSALTLSTTLRSAAQTHGDKDCLRTMDGRTLSFAGALSQAESQAAALADLGVGPGDRVVLIMDNSVEMVVTWFAVNLLGAVEVPCNTANRGASLAHVLNNSQARLAILDPGYVDSLAEVAHELSTLGTVVVNGAVPAGLPWRTAALADLQADPEDSIFPEVTYRDPASIIYTSGTTGPAKGVLVPHAHMHTFAAHVVEQLEIDRDDVYYVCLPLFHANAQFMQVLPCLMTGATAVIANAFSASGWVRDLVASEATVTSLLGVMAQYVHNQPATSDDTRHRVRRMITIPMPAAIAKGFEQRFSTTCIEAYGMTEICLPIYRPRHEPLRPGSCGKALEDWFEVRIVDPHTDEPLPTGQVGEIVVRPRHPFTTFLEYNAMPERTVEAWRNLWFHTGDAGRRDEDGFYYFVDRLRDRIRRKGENVTSYDIEIALTELDAITDAAAIAVPAREGDDDVLAIVMVAADAAPDPVDILNHCARRLPYFAVPRYVEFVTELPKTATGKILKRDLRQRRVEGAAWDREANGWTVRRGVAALVPLAPQTASGIRSGSA